MPAGLGLIDPVVEPEETLVERLNAPGGGGVPPDVPPDDGGVFCPVIAVPLPLQAVNKILRRMGNKNNVRPVVLKVIMLCIPNPCSMNNV